MSARRKLHIGMSLAPTWLSGDAWRRPDSNIEGLFNSDFYLDIARRSEAAHLDFVFCPDTLFLRTEVLEAGPGFSSLDPTMLLASIARETTHVGLLTTISTTFLPPYVVARQIQSLNWLSKGRAGWNIVTALAGHENFGLPAMPSAEERYERAAEFTEVVKLLWESYPQEALKMDRASGRFADPSLVQPVDYAGKHLKVSGPLNLPTYGRAPVPLVQAGASPAGRSFAACVADAVFASTPDREAAIDLRLDLRRRAKGYGRHPDSINIMPGLSLFLAESRAEAFELFAQTHARADEARKFAMIREMTGLDLLDWPRERAVAAADLPPPLDKPRSRTHANLLRRLIERETPTVEQLLWRPEVIGSAHWQVIGTVDDAIEAIRDWTEAGAIDGFIAVPGGSVSSLHLVLDELVPRLVEAGLFRESYSGTTFADHLRQ
ncbi:NtaA/DmoA family FMN-dependent monooxygenase [Mesorhizobium sp. RMAD-H1]|uniref:NtaA/DmoA family FMN-dependent monooxygenase n=1 Tax=Mesorhizobium sp. RMAD-H1 TaxID=2587065 RepID=UPI00161492F4|nr:NtaA/DmoA family FMN-dependent monooxygenase [Mesorhizobium sp. RMAD-H1]MBB2972788.1 FMN-dependent oxidoreductase (nitrilotriacetate monooxygenase family) [Mesorhizobium sp. RMAD-H1]